MTFSHKEHYEVKSVLKIGILLLLVIVLGLTLSSNALSNPPPQGPEPPAPTPPLPTEVRLSAKDHGRQIELTEGQPLVIGLEGNPSTGYMWEVEEGSEKIIRQAGEIEFRSESNLLGAPAKQIMRFEALEEGQAALELVYRRPWEREMKPAKTFSLQVQAVGPFTGVDIPPTIPQAKSSAESAISVADQPQLGLPPSFNWCDEGGCTPVKNQGDCGSCWAFSTVGPLESNILIHDGLTEDLSEQYLLSCNTDFYSCSGGWWAHDYHWWKVPPGEPDAGAVYEIDFPYTAADDPCSPPHTHHEKIDLWAFVGPEYGIPSVANIKQAISDHGPVSVAVCAGPTWPYYEGGVFETDESSFCPDIPPLFPPVNHAVILVGWDDDPGVWILRNSWGAGWGESGYMRIGYGISNVGYSANYIAYSPSVCYSLNTSVSPSGRGTITADPGPNCAGDKYLPGTEVQLTANPESGWHFTGWSGDASGSSNPTTITMNSDKSVTAHFMCDGCQPWAFLPLVVNNY